MLTLHTRRYEGSKETRGKGIILSLRPYWVHALSGIILAWIMSCQHYHNNRLDMYLMHGLTRLQSQAERQIFDSVFSGWSATHHSDRWGGDGAP